MNTLASALLLASGALAWTHVTPWSVLGSNLGLMGQSIPKTFAVASVATACARFVSANLQTYALLAHAVVLICRSDRCRFA